MVFENIEYLKTGNNKQKQVYQILKKHKIFSVLHEFTPLLVGTIPLNIDIENSDLDIICYYKNERDFLNCIIENFSDELNFCCSQSVVSEENAIIASFIIDGFEVEIFGQNIPCLKQNAYRHMIIEDKILKTKTEEFRQQIITLKQQGYKTEPAFAIALGISGDPYKELLHFDGCML